MADRPAAVAPLLLSSDNAVAAVGQSWRWCRDQARALGVPVIEAGRKSFIDAARFIEALRADRTATPAPALPAEPDEAPVELSPEQAAEVVRRSLGKRRRAA